MGTSPPADCPGRCGSSTVLDDCHAHDIETFPGVASNSFVAPDHEYPVPFEIILTATDSNGVSDSVTRQIDYRTVPLTFQSVPSGLSLTVKGTASTTPFTRTVIQGSANSVSATTPQTLGSKSYDFTSWSDSRSRHPHHHGRYGGRDIHRDLCASRHGRSHRLHLDRGRPGVHGLALSHVDRSRDRCGLEHHRGQAVQRRHELDHAAVCELAAVDPAGHGRHSDRCTSSGGTRPATGAAVKTDTIVLDTVAPTVTEPRRGLVAATNIDAGRITLRVPWSGSGRHQRDRPLRAAPEHRRRSLDDGLDDAHQPDRRPLAGQPAHVSLPGARRGQGRQRRGVGLRHAPSGWRATASSTAPSPTAGSWSTVSSPALLGWRGQALGHGRGAGVADLHRARGRVDRADRAQPRRGHGLRQRHQGRHGRPVLARPTRTSGSCGRATGRPRRRARSPSAWPAPPAARWSISTPSSRRIRTRNGTTSRARRWARASCGPLVRDLPSAWTIAGRAWRSPQRPCRTSVGLACRLAFRGGAHGRDCRRPGASLVIQWSRPDRLVVVRSGWFLSPASGSGAPELTPKTWMLGTIWSLMASPRTGPGCPPAARARRHRTDPSRPCHHRIETRRLAGSTKANPV